MLFAIDIGNTNMVIGCIDGDNILFSERISTDHSKTALEYALTFKNILDLHNIDRSGITGAIIASVVPPVQDHVLPCQDSGARPQKRP